MARRQRVKIERSDEEPATALEIDIRGLRVDEAIGEVERRLDRAVLDDVRQIRVIHGHGTAALKKAVRIYLKRSPYVEKFRPEPQELGGDGATRVILKGE
jgi:DNA mismatch repair protein MutS2